MTLHKERIYKMSQSNQNGKETVKNYRPEDRLVRQQSKDKRAKQQKKRSCFTGKINARRESRRSTSNNTAAARPARNKTANRVRHIIRSAAAIHLIARHLEHRHEGGNDWRFFNEGSGRSVSKQLRAPGVPRRIRESLSSHLFKNKSLTNASIQSEHDVHHRSNTPTRVAARCAGLGKSSTNTLPRGAEPTEKAFVTNTRGQSTLNGPFPNAPLSPANLAGAVHPQNLSGLHRPGGMGVASLGRGSVGTARRNVHPERPVLAGGRPSAEI